MEPIELRRAAAPQPAARRRKARRSPVPLDLVIPAGTIALILFLCFLSPLLYPIPDPVGGRVLESSRPILSAGHLLGTDLNGNDTWSRLLYGGRSSLQIAAAVNVLGLLLGGSLGALGAYRGGFVDSIIMRTFDILIAFPSLVLALAIVQVSGPGQMNTIWALCFYSVPAFARVARGATVRLRDQPFMLAAKLSGTTTARILAWHVGPNVMPQLVTFASLGVGIVIIIEGALSFLGLGIPPPRPSWGNMIFQGQQVLLTNPSLALMPSLFLFVTVLSFNLLGDALRVRWSRP